MTSKPGALPSDLASAYMALLAEREALQAERDVAVADAANARAELSDNEALIAHLELRIEKLKRELYGQRSERTARLLEQLEFGLGKLFTTAGEDELAAQAAAAKTQNVRPFMRKRPVRKPWPDDIERERVVIEAPTTCACCGGSARREQRRGRRHRGASRSSRLCARSSPVAIARRSPSRRRRSMPRRAAS